MIEVDKILLIVRMSFTLDCNHRDVIPKKTALHYTNVQMLADTCTDKPAHTLACGLRT